MRFWEWKHLLASRIRQEDQYTYKQHLSLLSRTTHQVPLSHIYMYNSFNARRFHSATLQVHPLGSAPNPTPAK